MTDDASTEYTINPHVMQWLRFQRTIEQLAQAGGVTEQGWDWLRTALRPGGEWQVSALPEAFRPQHALMLDFVVHKLVEHRPSLRAYYVDSNRSDTLEAAVPDDLSGLGDTAS